MSLKELQRELRDCATEEKAKAHQWFFKTGPGQYGEGDLFLGVTVPEQRQLAKKYRNISLQDTLRLLKSKYHEERLSALFILIHKFDRGSSEDKKTIYELYLKHTKYINNWDLVDSSAYKICGPYLLERDRKILYDLAVSEDLWERRISIMTTYHFIKHDDFNDTLALSKILLEDEHDLIHKAVGWMLRELGKRDINRERAFLDKHASRMPRTMLRYAIEKFPEKLRKQYLAMK